jgi:hypothetical protein
MKGLWHRRDALIRIPSFSQTARTNAESRSTTPTSRYKFATGPLNQLPLGLLFEGSWR